ncbi:MAG: hypothetical protein IPP66_04270 [Anaerolineales bacterium]|nr:hypothetical protein [Anaerolineales bacterium]
MKQLRIVYHLMLADFLERIRRYDFLLMLLFTVFITYLFIPALDSFQIVGLQLGGYRSVYNSAWIGSMTTLLLGEFFLIFAFYLLKGTIERDRKTGVGQIIATTPIIRSVYMLGKWLSNVAVITAMVAIIIFSAAILQWMRGEDLSLNVWLLSAPFLIVLLPALSIIAAVAILFDSINFLRGGLGSVLFFFLAYPMVYLLFDLPGNTIIYPSIFSACSAQFAGCIPNRQIDGGLPPLQDLPTFHYEGVAWTAEIVLGRLALILVGAVIVVLAAGLFHRFDPAKADQNLFGNWLVQIKQMIWSFITVKEDGSAQEETIMPTITEHVHLTPLSSELHSNPGWLRQYSQLFLAELRLTLKGLNRFWYLIAILLIGAPLFAPSLTIGDTRLGPAEVALSLFLPLAWIWPLTIWSNIGSHEARYRVEQIVFSAPYPLRRHLPVTWLVGISIALVMAGGVIVQLVLAGLWVNLLAVCIGALFVPTLALAMGCWSGGSKLFEGLYLFFWYLSSIYSIPYLDFMGRVPVALSWGMPWVFAGLTFLLIGATVIGRQRQIKL